MTTATRVRLDLVKGRIVRDEDGRKIGRVRDVKAEKHGDDLVVVEYHVGNAALLHRFGISLLSVIGVDAGREPKRIPWNLMDITNPAKPKFLGKAEALRHQPVSS